MPALSAAMRGAMAPATTAAAAAIEGVIEQVSREGLVHAVFDFDAERISLGGLLLLRQEAELLADLGGAKALVLHAVGPQLDVRQRALINSAWQSIYDLELRFEQCDSSALAWPSSAIGYTGFSYQFFDRIGLLASLLGRRPPQLSWPTQVIEQAHAWKARFGGRLIVAHLKNAGNQSAEESNGNQDEWAEFFASSARPGTLEFLLLGSDPAHLPVTAVSGVERAEAFGLPLEVQLALAGCADGFLGMASGVCAAAVLSTTPYLLFKHPSHHIEEMQRELGGLDYFPFAGLYQWVWRRADTAQTLKEALAEIAHAWME